MSSSSLPALSLLASPAPPADSPAALPHDAHDAHDTGLVHIDIGTKLLNITAITLPLAGLIAGIVLLWGRAVGGFEIALLLVGYLLTAGTVTLGYHRYFTHKSFECPRWVQWIIGAMASSSMQGSLFGWVSTHRCHHQFSDRPGDPHSPHVGHDHDDMGPGLKGLLKGMWHSHVGWCLLDTPNCAHYIPDLINDPVARPVSRLFPLWVIGGILLGGALGLLWYHTWMGALTCLLWGGLGRICLTHHMTWSINSACHLWGGRTYRSPDHSRNNAIFGVLSLGEGWHNNHHAFPASARHGLEWWQLDLTWLTIKAMEKFGLAWDINLPKPERMAAKREIA